MSKPTCPDCGKTDKVVKSDSGYHYACQRCGDIFDRDGNKIPKR
jgi:transposase